MGKYLQQALSPAVLNHAWRLLHNDRGCWRPGLPMAQMQWHLVRHIGELAQQILAGTYRPDPMRCYEVTKANGKKRILCVASVRDKLVQRAVLTVLEPLGEALFHKDSFGFRPYCTVDMALARVRERVREGWVWVGDADIQACFDMIPQRPVAQRLWTLCRDRELVRLLEPWLASMPNEFRLHGADRGLPQGMVLSPFLCNLHLHELDTSLTRAKIPFVRFADDFVVFGHDEAEAKAALKRAGDILRNLGLNLHPEKTRVIRSAPQHHFLGKRFPNSQSRAVV